MTNAADSTLPGMPQQAPPPRPPVVVDLDLDDIEDISFSPYKFKKSLGDKVVVFTLTLNDDYLLAEFAEQARDGDIYELYCQFLEKTATSAIYEDGTEVDVKAYLESEGVDIEQHLTDAVHSADNSADAHQHDRRLGAADMLIHMLYEHQITLKKISQLVQSAISQWSDELTDTSMRPQRLSRRDRRARK